MPQNDVSWVLDDGAFNDTFSLIRTPSLTSGLPDTQNAVVMSVRGVVLPGRMEHVTLVTLTADNSHSTKSITVHTRTRLYDVMYGYQPDIVIYRGNQFKVMKVWDYSRYGTGYYAVDCDMQDLSTNENVSSQNPVLNSFGIGINLSGMEDGSNIPGVAGTDYAVPTTAEMDYQKSIGMSWVRLTGLWGRLQPTLFGPLNSKRQVLAGCTWLG